MKVPELIANKIDPTIGFCSLSTTPIDMPIGVEKLKAIMRPMIFLNVNPDR
jgi:hypothetical protein